VVVVEEKEEEERGRLDVEERKVVGFCQLD
jgi:hypothetical protein